MKPGLWRQRQRRFLLGLDIDPTIAAHPAELVDGHVSDHPVAIDDDQVLRRRAHLGDGTRRTPFDSRPQGT